MQPGYNPTHTLENRSTISSRLNQTGKVNDPLLSNTMSCKRLHIIVMKLQTLSESNPSDRDIVLLRIKINSKKAQIYHNTWIQSAKLRTNLRRHNIDITQSKTKLC